MPTDPIGIMIELSAPAGHDLESTNATIREHLPKGVEMRVTGEVHQPR